MKKNKNTIIYALIALLGSTVFSCKTDFIDVNTDPIGSATAQPHKLMINSLVNIMGTNMLRNRNFNNELMQVTVDISDSESKVFRYAYRRTWGDYTWTNWYTNLTDIKDIYNYADGNTSYQGISLILQAWVFQLLTDMYGDVPYSQANLGREASTGAAGQASLTPAFDKQKDIYLDLRNKLEQANDLLKNNTAIVGSSDPVYGGDVTKWRRLGNSLYLRLLLRMSGKSEVASAVMTKIKEIVDLNPGNYPIMENNDHTAKILWNGTESTTAAYSSPFMVSVRPVDFRGTSLCDYFIGKLYNWNDPRYLPSVWGGNTASFSRWGIAKGSDGYVGVPAGYAIGTDMTKQAYFYSQGQTYSGSVTYPTLQTDPYTGIIMNSAEVYFILAEAAAKGWISSNTAKYYYDTGSYQAIKYWLPNYTITSFNTYQVAAGLSWNDTLPLENATGNSKMEMIHLQKYYAMFLVDMQQWFEYRRTSHPTLSDGVAFQNGGVMPARMYYPQILLSVNSVNYKNAIASQGPDEINTQVWWQKP